MKKNFPVIAVFMLLILLVFSAFSCIYITSPDSPAVSDAQNGDTSEPSDSASSQMAPPVINSFSASPGSIETGESSTLSWSVTGATTVSIDQGIGNVALNGSRVVNPAASTVYTLLATNAGGSMTATAMVGVSSPAPPEPTPNLPVIDNFTLNPDTIEEGESAVLSWSTSNATSVTIDQGIGAVAPAGSTDVSPAESTVYTITATNSYSWASRSIALGVTSDEGIFVFTPGVFFLFAPDLEITDVWNDDGTIWYTITNNGIADSPASHSRLYVDGAVKATDDVGPLAAGASRNEKFGGYSYSCSGTSDTIAVRTDINNAVDETDEDNNLLKESWFCNFFFNPVFPGP
jgi:hypothetical protein